MRPPPRLPPRWIAGRPTISSITRPDFEVYEELGKVVVAGGKAIVTNVIEPSYFTLPATNTGWSVWVNGYVYLKVVMDNYATRTVQVLAGATMPISFAGGIEADFYMCLAAISGRRITPIAGGLGPIWMTFPTEYVYPPP